MAVTQVNFFVLNCSSEPISGTAVHQSGDGSNSTRTSLSVSNLGVAKATNLAQTNSRSNHDDYWSWTGSDKDPRRVQFNVHASELIVLVVTDVLLVVVTSGRDKVESGKLA